MLKRDIMKLLHDIPYDIPYSFSKDRFIFWEDLLTEILNL